MSPFKFACQNCGQRLAAFEDQIGTSEPCPSCGSMVTVVAPSPSPTLAPKDAAAKTPADEKAESKPSETELQAATPKAAQPATAATEAVKGPVTVDARHLATDAATAPPEGREPSRKPPLKSKQSDRSAVSGMPSPAAPADTLHSVLERIMASRFLTISILIHAFVVLTLGGTVLYHVAPQQQDFEASGAGLVDTSDQAQPPEASSLSQSMAQELAPQAPLTAPLNAMITAAQRSPTWTVKIEPSIQMRGLSDSMKGALAAMDSRRGPSAGMAGAGGGTAGGTRSAMIFGRRIMASRLGVILDVSGSAHPHLAGAVDEIQRGFSDAILILYPGCGITQFDGTSEHEIRKFSSIPRTEINEDADYFTTASQISSALKISEFAQMTSRASVKETLFVSWYAPKSGSSAKLIGRTQVAFDDLMKRGVDTIYWFSDFADAVDPRVVERLTSDLRAKRIKLHLHNFAGTDIDPVVRELAEKTGGTISVRKSGD